MAHTINQRTGTASEYYVMSLLLRMNKNVFMTTGTTKAIDIIIKTDEGIKTIDVKGVLGTRGWTLGKALPDIVQNHYFILVAYMNTFEKLQQVPECYIIPSTSIQEVTKVFKNRCGIYDREKIKDFKDKWILLNSPIFC